MCVDMPAYVSEVRSLVMSLYASATVTDAACDSDFDDNCDRT